MTAKNLCLITKKLITKKKIIQIQIDPSVPKEIGFIQTYICRYIDRVAIVLIKIYITHFMFSVFIANCEKVNRF